MTTCQQAGDTASLLLFELCLQDLIGLVRIGRALGANAALNQALRASTGGQIILGVSVRSSLANSEEWVSGTIVKECRRFVVGRTRTFIRAGSNGVEKLDVATSNDLLAARAGDGYRVAVDIADVHMDRLGVAGFSLGRRLVHDTGDIHEAGPAAWEEDLV